MFCLELEIIIVWKMAANNFSRERECVCVFVVYEDIFFLNKKIN